MERLIRSGSSGKLELLVVLESCTDDIWPLLTALKTYDSAELITLICLKLDRIDFLRLEFFLPQLCQIVMDKKHKALPLARWLVNQCRRSVRSALLVYFSFNAAVEDSNPLNVEYFRQLLKECYIAAITSNKNLELKKLYPLYREHVETHTPKPVTPRNSEKSLQELKDIRDSNTSYLRVKGEPEPAPPQSSLDPALLTDEQISIIEETVTKICEGQSDIFEGDVTVPPSAEMIHAKKLDSNGIVDLEVLAGSVMNLANAAENKPPETCMELLETAGKIYQTIQNPHPKSEGRKTIESLKEHIEKPIGEDEILFESVISRRLHRDYFHAQLRFVKGLCKISTMLVGLQLKTNREAKNCALRLALKRLNNNKDFLKGVYIPIFTRPGVPYRVIRIPHAEALCLNSRDRVPYMLNLEVVSGYAEIEINKRKKENLENIHENVEDAPKILPENEPKLIMEQKKSSNTNVDNSPSAPKATQLVDNYQIYDEWVCVNKAEEPDVLDQAFGPDWNTRKERLRKASPLGDQPGWDLVSIIVKSGDDLRQEQLAMQLIQAFYEVFKQENLPLFLNPYMVLSTSSDAGLLETVHDAISIHGLKKSLNIDSLRTYFINAYGPVESVKFKSAQRNFVESLAAYSLVCYLLQIKDRHNGNIMIDREGHIIHIDYGFMLSSSPGNIQFESAPFKLPLDFVAVMDGKEGELFEYFQTLFQTGFIALRKHYKKILTLVEMMMHAGNSQMACFQLGEQTLANLRQRFQLSLSEDDTIRFARGLVDESLGNWRTDMYDNFQYFSNGIL